MTKKSKILGLVLDRSQSMSKVWGEASSAFNDFIQEWTEKDPDLQVVLVTFNHEVDVGDPVPVADVELMVSPSGFTALYDASIMAINKLEEVTGGEYAKVVVAIITDGQENASSEYTDLDEVNRVITDKQDKDGWSILYLGTSNNEWSRRDLHYAGLGMGVKAGSTKTFAQTGRGYNAAYATMSMALADDGTDDEEDDS